MWCAGSARRPPPTDPICTSRPAEGAIVSGGDAPAPTNVNGSATVSLANPGDYTLRAARAGDLDSNLQDVCVSATAGECPSDITPRGRTIVGRKVADEFTATPGWDVVRSKGGDDRINLGTGTDRVNCGGGRDRIRIDLGDGDRIARNCEKVKPLSG